MAFPGRVEAMHTIPTGGAAVSATVANGGTATTVTLPAGGYYYTTAGGISSSTTALQTALNNASQGYPQTAAAMAAAAGIGTWTNGWLFNIASGNDAGAFGGATMTAVSSPTYGHAGARGGIDLMVGSDSVADGFDAGNIHDVDATKDIIAAFALYAPSVAGNEDIWGRDNGTIGYILVREAAALALYVRDGVDTVRVEASIAAGIPYICLLALERGTSEVRIATIPFYGGSVNINAASITALVGSLVNATNYLIGDNGTYRAGGMRIGAHYVGVGVGAATGAVAAMSTAISSIQAAWNASWTVTPSTTDGRVSIGWTGYTTPTWSLAWTSTTLRDLLGFTSDIAGVTTTQTGTEQAHGLWLPDAPLNCTDHPSMVPLETDSRSSESPTGTLLTLSGTERYAHSDVRWERCPVDRIRERSATYANASLEVFYRDCIVGMGHPWFCPGSDLQIWWNNAGTLELLGSDGVDADNTGTEGWRPSAVPKFKDLARPSQQNWVGQFDVRIPRLVSDG